MTSAQTCLICGQPFGPGEKRVYQITGFEELRRQGGANKIIARKTTGYAAHKTCVIDPPTTKLF